MKLQPQISKLLKDAVGWDERFLVERSCFLIIFVLFLFQISVKLCGGWVAWGYYQCKRFCDLKTQEE